LENTCHRSLIHPPFTLKVPVEVLVGVSYMHHTSKIDYLVCSVYGTYWNFHNAFRD